MGFVVGPRVKDGILATGVVSSRVATLVLQVGSDSAQLSIINNVHAPTGTKGKKSPFAMAKFYEDVQAEFIQRKHQGKVILAGDWNARLGKDQVLNRWFGPFVLGKRRNLNGDCLWSFLNKNKLFFSSEEGKEVS